MSSFHDSLVIVCVVLVAHNFVKLDSGRPEYGYVAFGELSLFVHCLLQKVKRSSDLPVIEKSAAYMLPNISSFGAIAEEQFLEGTCLLSYREKINGSFLRKEFRKDCRHFLEDFVGTILSTVAARSPVGQGLSRFFFVKLSLEVIRIQLFTSSGNFWMGCLNLVGLGCQKLSLQRLSSTFSSASSDRWNQLAIGLVCQLIASLRSAIRPTSVLGGNCTKFVIWCFEIISMFFMI